MSLYLGSLKVCCGIRIKVKKASRPIRIHIPNADPERDSGELNQYESGFETLPPPSVPLYRMCLCAAINCNVSRRKTN